MNKKNRKKIGIYVHIPFCVRKCAYCDFLSFPAGEEVKGRYAEALRREISGWQEREEWEAASIFFGGGTPSVLESSLLCSILEEIKRVFYVQKDAEITLEANPGTLDKKKLEDYRRAGFNRISLGLQSSHNEELKLLGRIHTWEEFLESFQLAREAGFTNVNVDMMSALPGQTVDSWRNTLQRICTLHPEHISAYSLIIEEGTPFYEKYVEDLRKREKGEICGLLPSEEDERRMYEITGRMLEKEGYRRYEISNYALEGYECRHNIGYWRRQDYIGFGLGAASLVNECRFCNTRDMRKYLSGAVSGEFEKEEKELLDRKARMEEFMFLGLRLCGGIRTEEFKKQFGTEFDHVYGEVTDRLVREGLIERTKGAAEQIRLTGKGLDLSNYAMAQYLLDEMD